MKSYKLTRSLTSVSSVVCGSLLLLASASAWACKCGFPTVEEDYLSSDVVFSGKVLRIDSVEDERRIKMGEGQNYLQTVEVELELNETWKGTDETKVTVLTALHEPSCGYDFSVGERYVVFAKVRKIESGEDGDIRALYTGLCTANHELDYDRATEALLEKLEELKSETPQEAQVELVRDAADPEE